jgi:non-ribosomal peptide synthetase component F
MVHADFRHHTPNLSLSYSAGIEAKIAQNVGSTLSKALTQLVSLDAESFMSMGELDLLSERDQQHLRSINHHYPVSIGSCVHDMISARAKISPHTEAIHSWDGSLTYKELDDLSARMAIYLCREFPHKIGPEMAIGICFEKSFAAVVSELAVLKTGSAFVPLDGEYPDDRLKVVSEIAEISLVLASPQYSARLEHHLKSVVCVPLSKSLLEAMLPSLQPDEIISSTSMATPEDAAFILFTSGSTGKPKAVVKPHQAICTLFQSHAESLHVDSSCRVFQFAAYTFDVSTMDIYTTLMQGGCLCIPSESDRRNNIAGFSKQARVNWADLTATVANLIYPQEVPTLKTLVLAGEAVQEKHLERWFGHVRLINCYDPVESGNCTAYEFRDRREKPAAKIGREMGGARCWIVAPQNPDRLASVGEVGEILVEGPTSKTLCVRKTVL